MQDPNKPEKQPSKWLTNLPIDSTILVQNFNPVVEGTDIAYTPTTAKTSHATSWATPSKPYAPLCQPAPRA